MAQNWTFDSDAQSWTCEDSFGTPLSSPQFAWQSGAGSPSAGSLGGVIDGDPASGFADRFMFSPTFSSETFTPASISLKYYLANNGSSAPDGADVTVNLQYWNGSGWTDLNNTGAITVGYGTNTGWQTLTGGAGGDFSTTQFRVQIIPYPGLTYYFDYYVDTISTGAASTTWSHSAGGIPGAVLVS